MQRVLKVDENCYIRPEFIVAWRNCLDRHGNATEIEVQLTNGRVIRVQDVTAEEFGRYLQIALRKNKEDLDDTVY